MILHLPGPLLGPPNIMSLLFKARQTVLVLTACILAFKQPPLAAVQADSIIIEAALGALLLRGGGGWDLWPDYVGGSVCLRSQRCLGPPLKPREWRIGLATASLTLLSTDSS